MYNPFNVVQNDGSENDALIRHALKGDSEALSELISRHQPWIYNIVFRMVMVREDAEDITQEILIKVITKLSSYDKTKASFTTWLYRIVVNHIINIKKSGYEQSISTPENYYSFIDTVPDENIELNPETNLIINDLAIGCVTGILLCMDREQRLIFILSIIFNVSSRQGSEIMDISDDAYRKSLSRARSRLYSFMNNKCGLITESAPCKCRNKVSEFIKQGWYKVDDLKFYNENFAKVRDIVSEKIGRFSDTTHAEFIKLYRNHPFYESPDMTEWLRKTLDTKEFKEIFNLN